MLINVLAFCKFSKIDISSIDFKDSSAFLQIQLYYITNIVSEYSSSRHFKRCEYLLLIMSNWSKDTSRSCSFGQSRFLASFSVELSPRYPAPSGVVVFVNSYSHRHSIGGWWNLFIYGIYKTLYTIIYCYIDTFIHF